MNSLNLWFLESLLLWRLLEGFLSLASLALVIQFHIGVSMSGNSISCRFWFGSLLGLVMMLP